MSLSAENFFVCLNAVAPIFVLMAVGYGARAAGLMDEKTIAVMNRAMFMVFLPVLLFKNIYYSDISSAFKPSLMLFAVAGALCVFALAWVASRFIDNTPAGRGVVIQALFRSNFVILGLPVAASLLGGQSLGPVALLVTVIVPLFNVLSVIVLEVFSGAKTKPGQMALDILKNPLIISSAIGVALLLTGLRLPKVLENTMDQMANVASPFMLFLLGAFFRFKSVKGYRRQLLWVTLGRLLAVPALFLSAAALLGFRGMDFVGLIGIFASPTAIASFTMAQQMGGDAELAGDIVVFTSALCPFTIFLWSFLFKSLGIF